MSIIEPPLVKVEASFRLETLGLLEQYIDSHGRNQHTRSNRFVI